MHRFHLPPEHTVGEVLTLEGPEAHHALRVLRLPVGAQVEGLDGAGQVLECAVREVAKRCLRLQVITRRRVAPLPWQVTLFQAIPRGKHMDWIVQKATELGAGRIVPLLTERTVVQADEDRAEHKADKWRVTAIEAIKQCGAAWLPRIESPATLNQHLARLEPLDLMLVASLQANRQHPCAVFHEFVWQHQRPPRSVGVWVGPEGDFTAEEIRAIEAAGARPITLGPLVLRSETAALYCLSVLSYELQAAHSNAEAFGPSEPSAPTSP